MTQPKSPVNVLQLICSGVTMLIFLFVPIVVFSLMGFTVLAFNGIRLLQFGWTIYCILLIGSMLMIAFSFGPLQSFSIIVAAIMLIAEIVLAAMSPSIMQKADISQLILLLPSEYATMANGALNFLANTAVKMGLGMYFMMGTTVLYGVFQFVNINLFQPRRVPVTSSMLNLSNSSSDAYRHPKL